MGKEKRKTRLNKGEAGEFIGFGAFANPTTTTTTTGAGATTSTSSSSSSASATAAATAASTVASTATSTATSSSSPSSSSVSLSPIYTGSDSNLSIVFNKISQKRDATTKSKALNELLSYMEDTTQSKKHQVDALSHFLYLYTTKLNYQYDSQTSSRDIRCTCLKILETSYHRLPKAFRTHTTHCPIILGMMVCTRSDPAPEVRNVATQFVQELLLHEQETTSTEDSATAATTTSTTTIDGQVLDEGVWMYVQKILSYGKPAAMYQDLFQRGGSNGGSSSGGGKGQSSNNANKKDRSSSSSSSSSMSDRNMEEMGEKYEKIVGTVLDGLNLYLQEPSVLNRSLQRTEPVQVNDDKINDNVQSTTTTQTSPQSNQDHPTSMIPTTPENLKYIWKMMNSHSASLRRKTYTLLSTFCQRIPYLLDAEKTSKMILQALSAEKEPMNVAPTLLETMLAFVASRPKPERSTVIEQYAKPLSKLFKKGCYGASASSWSPMVLPIVALLPSQGVTSSQATVLTSVWEGRAHVIGIVDMYDVIHCVVETSSFLLIQQSPNDLDQVIATCWVQSLQSFLSDTTSVTNNSNSGGGRMKVAYDQLLTALAKSWIQIADACVEKSSCAIYSIQHWFWTEQVSNVILGPNVNQSTLINLLFQIQQQQFQQQSENNDPLQARQEASPSVTSESIDMYSTMFVQKFHNLFASMNDSSSNDWQPNHDDYQLGIAILHLIGPNPVFQGKSNNDTVESFVLNKLLPWIIRHTSCLSTTYDRNLGNIEGRLFQACIVNDDSARRPDPGSLSETVLRELVAAKPGVDAIYCYLSMYIETLKWNSTDLVNMEYLQSYFGSIADEIENDDTNESKSPNPNTAQAIHEFLFNITGLDKRDRATGLIVSQPVILEWINLACPQDSTLEMGPNDLLNVLACMVRSKIRSIDDVGSQRVLVQCWRQDHDQWSDGLLPWLLEPGQIEIRNSLVDTIRVESKKQVHDFANTLEISDKKLQTWTARAVRLLQLCDDHPANVDENNDVPTINCSYSLDAVGLGDVTFWNENDLPHSPALAQCLLKLIETIDVECRWKLFESSIESPSKLLVAVLIFLSSGCPNALGADKARRGIDDAGICLDLLNFTKVKQSVKFDSIVQSCSVLSNLLGSSADLKSNENLICRIIAVLSQLIKTLFLGLRLNDGAIYDKPVNAENAEKGKVVWYIPDPEQPLVRIKCTILKVHTDLPNDVYFTIKVTGKDGETNERQTVGSRLRLNNITTTADKGMTGTINFDQVEAEEKELRGRLANIVLDSLINKTFSTWTDPCFEIYNILLTQVGLLGSRGIGTAHYAVVQNVSSIQTAFLASMESSDPKDDDVATILWRLSLALGWGMNVPASQWAIPLLGINASDTLLPLLAYLQDPERKTSVQLDCAAAAWLSVASFGDHIDKAIKEEAFSVLLQISARLLKIQNKSSNDFSDIHYIALRALEAAQTESHKSRQGESLMQDSEAEAINEFVNIFARDWMTTESPDDEAGVENEIPYSLPLFHTVMEASLNNRPQFVASASRRCLNELTDALYDESKRVYAMRILDLHSEEGRPIHGEDDFDIISPETNEKLKEWSKNSSQEEADSMEDDVHAVAQWTCRDQMNDIESWHVDDDIDDTVACGRMMSWLSFLRVVDAASIEDAVFYRPAFTSYVSLCKAVDAMMDLAMIYANVGTNRKAKLDVVVPLEEILRERATPSDPIDLSKLAAFVLFRSIEIFPTLSKYWWESECPGYGKQAIQDFVETQVSPKILERSLASIAEATAFGEMKVKGSVSSSRVTASYMQDEFTLSVAIRLPPAFPFRLANVDCSQTLGIPESQFKRWQLQITQMLNNQGGTLKEALLFWKDNVDKEFEGVEPCPVCYSILHVRTHKQPNLECRTCHNRFHTDCLYEWFRNSGKSTCVICQQPWSGIRV